LKLHNFAEVRIQCKKNFKQLLKIMIMLGKKRSRQSSNPTSLNNSVRNHMHLILWNGIMKKRNCKWILCTFKKFDVLNCLPELLSYYKSLPVRVSCSHSIILFRSYWFNFSFFYLAQYWISRWTNLETTLPYILTH